MINKIYKERALITKFVLVGVVGFCVNFLVLRIVNDNLHFNKIVAEIVAAIVALQVTFLLNNAWTYKVDDKDVRLQFKLKSRYLTYLASNSFGSLMTVLLFALFSNFTNRLIALALAAFLSMIWNFTMNKIIIWRKVVKQVSGSDS